MSVSGYCVLESPFTRALLLVQADKAHRPPPTGPLFSLVTSPNYTAEVSAWIGFAVMLRLLSVYVFAAAGFYQMTVWALGKYKGYLATDKAYARARKAIIPFVL